MLTTPRAIVVAAVLVVAGLLAQAAASRYNVVAIDGGAAFIRVDHLAGTATISAPKTNPAPWLTAYGQADGRGAFASAWQAVEAPGSIVIAFGIVAFVIWRYRLAWQAEQRHKAEIVGTR